MYFYSEEFIDDYKATVKAKEIVSELSKDEKIALINVLLKDTEAGYLLQK